MVNVDKAFELRYKTGKEEIQVLVDFDKLNEFKKKPQEISVYDVLADTKIFKDQKKGEIASANLLSEIFPKKSEEDILKEILLKGECQIPTSYLNKLRDEKKEQVINFIVENAINPQSKSRYTRGVIEDEINRIKFNFQALTDFQIQAEEVFKILKKRMPISMEKVILETSIPAQYCGAFYGPFRKYGKITKEYYDNEGSLRLHLELTEAQADSAIDFIKKHTNNEASYYIKRNK